MGTAPIPFGELMTGTVNRVEPRAIEQRVRRQDQRACGRDTQPLLDGRNMTMVLAPVKRAAVESHIPMRRAGDASEMAAAVAFLEQRARGEHEHARVPQVFAVGRQARRRPTPSPSWNGA